MNKSVRLLLADEEQSSLRMLEAVLSEEGYSVTSASDGSAALACLDQHSYDVVLASLSMKGVDGRHILGHCRDHHPGTEIILLAQPAHAAAAVDALDEGAFHYLVKPAQGGELRRLVHQAATTVRLRRESVRLRGELDKLRGPADLITRNQEMQRVLDLARRVAPTGCSMLIVGESGTGKEKLARYIHSRSERAEGPFIAVNCSALSEDFLSGELFGHGRGAIHSAATERAGLVESASGGTLYLDEIDAVSPALQLKILSLIEKQEITRLGEEEARQVDVRVLGATRENPKEALKTGRLREDLYYRLNVVTLALMPLASRRDDIALLARYFMTKHAAAMKRPVRRITNEALALLTAHDYPGNVRELENIIQRGVALADGKTLEPHHMPEELHERSHRFFRSKDGQIASLDEQERDYIQWVLEETGGNQTQAAHILGIDRVSLWRKLKRYQTSNHVLENI